MSEANDKVINVSWDDVHDFCKKVYSEVSFDISSGNITHVVGIMRGGMPMATIMANILGVPMLAADIEEETGEVLILSNNETPLTKDSNVLIVDDVCETSETMKKILRLFFEHGILKVRAMVYAAKKDLKHKPTFYSIDYEDNEYVLFPWNAKL